MMETLHSDPRWKDLERRVGITRSGGVQCFPAIVCKSISLRWSEEESFGFACSINITSLQDEK